MTTDAQRLDSRRFAFVDADIICYTAAARCETQEIDCDEDVELVVDNVIDEWTSKQFFYDYQLVLTQNPTFRHKIWPNYKAHRSGKEKPRAFELVRAYLEAHTKSIVAPDGLEADDYICQQLGNPKFTGDAPIRAVAVSTDKDFQQIPGWHFNPVKDLFPYRVTKADADRFLAIQVIMGDSADNFKGLPGIGAAKAPKLYEEALRSLSFTTHPENPATITMQAYLNFYADRAEGEFEGSADEALAKYEWGVNWTMARLLTWDEEVPNELPFQAPGN